VSIAANERIASEYERAIARTARRPTTSSNSRSCAAITKLAARRLMSHSHGPGNVSSKSLMSNTIVRSGDS